MSKTTQAGVGTKQEVDPGRTRRAVLEALKRAMEPLTVRQLRHAVREVDPTVRPSSVDDQLDVLIAEGVVAQINFGRRYELRQAS